MSTTDWYQLTVYIGKLLNTQVMNERDYIKVIRVFFQLQVLLTKLAVGACYSILEKIAEKGSIQDPKAEQVAQPRTPVIKASKMDGDASKGLSDLEEKKNSLMMVPFDTVKAASLAGLSLTGKVATAPMHACSYAANLSWNMVSKVSQASKSLIRRNSEDPKAKASRMSYKQKREFVTSLLRAKESSGKTFAQIADECNITNVYCAQIFHNQAQLKPGTAQLLRKAVPALTDTQIHEMVKAPIRMFDSHLLQEPNVCRMNEAVMHYGESLKALINEEFGDGAMSAVDFYVTLDKAETPDGGQRMVISFNGKYLPHPEQKTENGIPVYD